jgi:hypothetical protein|tara:strand:- start:4281 stop:4619 length:339 start_codon:yes stop_codon:yes gene_type:complete
MELKKITLPVNGKDIELQFADDIPWGEFQTVIKESTNGGSLDFNQFSDRLLRIAVKSESFDFLNQTEVKKVGAKEMTAIIGKMLEILPLGVYMNNLGMGSGGSLDKILDQKP